MILFPKYSKLAVAVAPSPFHLSLEQSNPPSLVSCLIPSRFPPAPPFLLWSNIYILSSSLTPYFHSYFRFPLNTIQILQCVPSLLTRKDHYQPLFYTYLAALPKAIAAAAAAVVSVAMRRKITRIVIQGNSILMM